MSDDELPEPVAIKDLVKLDNTRFHLWLQQDSDLKECEYEGTDIWTGNEYYRSVEPPIRFFVDKANRRVIVYQIGADEPETT